jgi:hypothetical protein
MAESTGARSPRKKKIILSAESMASVEVESTLNQLSEAKKVPLVRNIGEPEKTGGGFQAVLWLVLSGAVGGLVTWVIWATLLTEEMVSDTTASNILTTMSVAVVVGMALVIGDTLQASATSKLGQRVGIGIGVALLGGLMLGVVANLLYTTGIERIFDDLLASGLEVTDDAFFDELFARNHLNRGIAWSLVGLAAGLTVGIASLQPKRILITSIGGLVGGFLGGFLFDFMPGEAAAQILGLLVTGLAIGGSIALTEEAAKTAWIEITHGGMAGKQFILYKRTVSLGSSPSADITLIKDQAMPAMAATMERVGGQMVITSIDQQSPAFVNGQPSARSPLRDGDTISLGATGLRYRERGKKAVSSGVVR